MGGKNADEILRQNDRGVTKAPPYLIKAQVDVMDNEDGVLIVVNEHAFVVLELLRREIPARGEDPFFGAGEIGESGNAPVDPPGVVDEIQRGLHRRGAFADDDGAANWFAGRRRGRDQLRDDRFADVSFGHRAKIPDAIIGGIEGRVGEQLFARTDKLRVCNHAMTGGDGQSSFRVDVERDGHRTRA